MKETGKITAYITREAGSQSGAVVPVLFDNRIMMQPDIIKIGGEYFICTNTAPLSYQRVNFAEASEVIDGKIQDTNNHT